MEDKPVMTSTFHGTVSRLDAEILRFKKDVKVDIDRLQNRLPLWATFMMAVMTGAITSLITMVKMGG